MSGEPMTPDTARAPKVGPQPDGSLYCYGGCGTRYQDFPCDLLLPTDLWNRIAVGGPFDEKQESVGREGRGGVLCPVCIVSRVAALPDCTAIFADTVDRRASPLVPCLVDGGAAGEPDAAYSDALKACEAITAFHDQCFVGLPLMLDGKPIDHTLLNKANEYAIAALSRSASPQEPQP